MSETTSPDYVITLVHGTFAPRSPWTLASSYFREQLSGQLPGSTKYIRFLWGGANDPEKRLRACELLKRRIRLSLNRWPKAQHIIVAHSHGGNIVDLVMKDAIIAERITCVVSVASPFLQYRNRQWIGRLVEKKLPDFGTGLVLALHNLNNKVDALQENTAKYAVPERDQPRWLALLAHGDEAAATLQLANLIGRSSLFFLNPALVVVIGIAVSIWMFFNGAPFLSELMGEPLFERIVRGIAQLAPARVAAFIFLLGLIPLLLIALFAVRLYLQAFGGTLAYAAAWKVRVNNKPSTTEASVTLKQIHLAQLFSDGDRWRKFKHLLSFRLLHGVIFHDQSSIHQISRFIENSPAPANLQLEFSGTPQRASLDPPKSSPEGPMEHRFTGSFAVHSFWTVICLAPTVVAWNVRFELEFDSLMSLLVVIPALMLLAFWYFILFNWANLLKGAYLRLSEDGFEETRTRAHMGIVAWDDLTTVTMRDDGIVEIGVKDQKETIWLDTNYFGLEPVQFCLLLRKYKPYQAIDDERSD